MTVSMAPQGLRPERRVLSNGARVTVKETRKTAAVSINLALPAGSAWDPLHAGGAMYLLSRVIDRGTASRSADEIADLFESRGITLDVSVNRHLFSFLVTCLAEDFALVIELLSEIVRAPAIPENELATRKREVITAIRQDEDNPSARAVERLMMLLYGLRHPYGRPLKGSVESIERINRDDLVALHRERFTPDGLSLVVVGDVDSERVMSLASASFGNGAVAPAAASISWPPVVAAAARRREVVPMPSKAQAEIAYGFTTIRRTDPQYYAYWLMNNVLGQYAMGGRLGSNIRERQGMAYWAASVLDANVIEGPLIVRAGVSPENVDRAVAAIDDELWRLRRDGVTERELNESRQYLIGSMPRALETNAGIATFLQTSEFFGLGADYDVRLPDLLQAVTLDDVKAAAERSMDPDSATLVIAGPYQA